MRRAPAVADLFYPGDPDTLRRLLATFPLPRSDRRAARGLVVPHAGYRFSGFVAASVYAAARIPSTLILLGPNHRGAGSGASPPGAALYGAGVWETPLGAVTVNDELTALLADETPLLEIDPKAHREEHSLEVQLPLLLHYAPTPPTIVPIVLSMTGRHDIDALGNGIARAVARYPGEVALVASTDFSHYVPQARAERDDKKAMEQIEWLDPAGLLSTTLSNHISMCGVGPVAAMITAAKGLGATKTEVIDYRTSGDVTGETGSVVGYGGALIY